MERRWVPDSFLLWLQVDEDFLGEKFVELNEDFLESIVIFTRILFVLNFSIERFKELYSFLGLYAFLLRLSNVRV